MAAATPQELRGAERLAARFVQRRCIEDAPGDCLPMPPLHEHLVPVTLAVAHAMAVRAHYAIGDVTTTGYELTPVAIAAGVAKGATIRPVPQPVVARK